MFFDDVSGRPHARSPPTASSSREREGSVRKKRRIQRACDMCRLKKIKCEGGQSSRKACYNCVVANYDCTYVQTAKTEDRDKQYIHSLETRMVKLEQALRKHCPDSELLQNSWESISTTSGDVASPAPGRMTPLFSQEEPYNDGDTDSDDEELARLTLAENLEHVSLDPGAPDFFGKSSSIIVLQTALGARGGGVSSAHRAQRAAEKRPAFWDSFTWTTRPTGSRYIFSFPPDDLIQVLVDIYFREFNPFYPLLHRPTFEKNVTEGLHLCDEGFASTLLLVCAHGARLSDDPRVCPGNPQNHEEAGFQWFNQVKATLKVVCDEAPRLYDLQIAYLVASFTHMLPNPQRSWPVVGYGIRLAQALGAHRRKVYSNMPPVAAELLKRTFWSLIQIDRELSYHMGRPCAMQDEDFDVDLPTECDDEYWEPDNPASAFQQPAGKPSQISYFNCAIRLNRIQSFATRSLYSIRKSRVQLGQDGPEWEERAVRDLDSALNKWLASLPEHLQWNPNMPQSIFFTQSASLHGEFHLLQMAIHFPLLSPRKNRAKPTDLPSLMICTNAARSCIQILQIQYERAKADGSSQLAHFGCLFIAGLILLLNIWGTRHSAGAASDVFRDIEYVHKAMNLLKALEPRYPFGGRMGDALFELTRAGGLPLPQDPTSPYASHTAAAMAPPSTSSRSTASHSPIPVPPTSLPLDDLHAVEGTHPILEMSPFAPPLPASDLTTANSSALGALPDSAFTEAQREFSPDAIEQFMRTLAGISGEAAWSGDQTAPGVPQEPSVGEDMFAMFSDVGAAMQWTDWAGSSADVSAQSNPSHESSSSSTSAYPGS